LAENNINRADAFLVDTAVSNKTGIGTDYEWRIVNPDWNTMVKPYFKDHNIESYTMKYNAMLNAHFFAIAQEWTRILAVANGRRIVLLCHEEIGFCHRTLLIKWLYRNGLLNVVLNCDRVMCYACLNEYNAIERETEWTSIMGYTVQPCEDCNGEDF
jgi:hypothetical protein